MKFSGKSTALTVFALTLVSGCRQLSAQSDTISVNRTSLAFCVASNTSPAPTPRTITVLATGDPVVYDAVASPGWIRLNGSGAGKTIFADTASSPNILVQIDPSGYATGTSASGIIQVSSGPTLVNVTVTVSVTPSCVDNGPLTANPSSVTLTPNLVSQAVSISGGTAGETANANLNFGNGPSGWFSITSSNFAVLPYTLTVTSNVSATNVAYNGTITLTTNITQSSVTIPVALTSGSAGSGAFVVNPVAISQNFASSTSSAVSQLITISPGLVNGVPITATLDLGNGPSGWITLTSPPGTVPTTSTVTIDPSNLSNGTFSGSITFTQTGVGANFVKVPITATVGVTGVFTVDVSPVNFSIPPGTTSQSQQVNVTGPANAQIVVNSQTNNGPQGWLAVTPNSATISTTPAALMVTVNAAVLSPGILYSGTILVLQNGVTVLTIPVNVIVGGPSAITVSPAQLNFAYQTGSAAPPSQTISVSSPAGTSLTFLATVNTTNCGNWLVVSPTQSAFTNGTTPIPVTVSLNTAALSTPGSCTGSVTIASAGATNPTTTIPVSLLVTKNAVLTASPSSLSFILQSGSAAPPAQTIAIASSSTPLNFSVAAIPASGANFLIINQTSTATPANLSIGVSPSVLSSFTPGTYVENVLISSSNSANGAVIVPVTLTISSIATFVVSPASLTSNYQIGQAQPPAQILTVASTGTAIPFSATATSTNCGNFLSVFPSTGLTAPGLSQTGGQIAVTTSVGGLTTPTTCTGTITITTPASGTSVTVPVTVNVVNTAVLNVGKTNIIQTASLGSTALITIQIPLTASDNLTQINFSTAAAGQSWLSVFPQTGSTPTNIFVQINPANLAAGVYTGVVTVKDTRSGSAVPVQVIQVMLLVSGQASVTPGSLNFTISQGGTAPSQTITVNNVLSGTTISANPATFLCGTNWITTNISGNTINVGVNGTGLTTAMSPCLGEVSVLVPGASNSPLNVPVSLTITPAITLAVSNSNIPFAFSIGSGTTPQNQTVQLTATSNAVLPYAASFTTQSVANLFTLSVSSGNIPALLTIGVNPSILATLAPGTATGVITISSPNLVGITINVSLTVSLPAQPAISAIVNGASQRVGALSPGELITIYGTNIGPPNPISLTLTPAGTVLTNLGSTSVLFDGVAAPLLYVSPTQINAIVPYEMGGRIQMTVSVSREGVSSNAVQIRGADTSLAIFTVDSSGQGQAAVVNQNGSVNGPANPAPKLSIISIYATGEGQLSPPGFTGAVTSLKSPAPKPLAGPPTLVFRINNADGTTTDVPAQITYAAEAPGLVSGIMQVNAIVPASVPSGSQIVILSLGSASTSPVTVQVQ